MIWIIATLHLIALLLGILLHVAKHHTREQGTTASKQLSVKKTAYGPPVLKPEWNKPKPQPDPIQLQITAPNIPQQRDFHPIRPIKQPTAAEIRLLASNMASIANMQLEQTTWLWNEIISNGGIRPYRNDKEIEEYKSNVPPHYRRTAGQAPDEIASILGYESDSNLYNAIQTEVRLRTSLTANLPNKKYTVKYFLEDAREKLIEIQNPHLSA